MTRHADVLAAVDDALGAVTVWCDEVRQDAERRRDLPAGAEAAIGDPWYVEALEIYSDLKALRARLRDAEMGSSS
ncbi:hypothetical protein [Salinispora pacifica]|uniref:hypothetical protein n=1 Tax=Salinispora pacifica TaxID=351187 RepID=UPI0003640538|nr:hypothetical protein [Salinispora pacifica]